MALAGTESTYGLNLIARSLRVLNVLGEGQTPAGSMATDAFVELKSLVDSWRLERLLISTVGRTEYTLTINVASYSIGPAQIWANDRPVFLDSAALMPASPSINETPVPVLSTAEYNAIPNKGVASAWPVRGIYLHKNYNLSVVNGTIKLTETPSVSGLRLVLYQPSDTANIQDLSSTLYYLPPGYSRALKYNLARELADDYPGSWTARLEEKAIESKAALKRVNEAPGVLRGDPFWTNRGWGYDIMRGE